MNDEAEREALTQRINENEQELKRLRELEVLSVNDTTSSGYRRAGQRLKIISEIQVIEESLRTHKVHLAEFGGHAGHKTF